jgi:hypothetical protein
MAEDSTQPPHATRFVETTRGVLSYAQLAPLLAERVLLVQQDIEDEVFAHRPLDESLLLGFHRALCGDLTPNLRIERSFSPRFAPRTVWIGNPWSRCGKNESKRPPERTHKKNAASASLRTPREWSGRLNQIPTTATGTARLHWPMRLSPSRRTPR